MCSATPMIRDFHQFYPDEHYRRGEQRVDKIQNPKGSSNRCHQLDVNLTNYNFRIGKFKDEHVRRIVQLYNYIKLMQSILLKSYYNTNVKIRLIVHHSITNELVNNIIIQLLKQLSFFPTSRSKRVEFRMQLQGFQVLFKVLSPCIIIQFK